METKKPATIKELRQITKPIRNVNIAHKENLSKLDKIALWTTQHVGSAGFFLVIFIWTIAWLLWNTQGPSHLQFDPYPAFVLWLFISNMIQLFLLPLLLIGQNLQSKHSEIRSEIEFDVNVKSEKEIELVLSKLELQNELLTQILEKIDSKKNGAK